MSQSPNTKRGTGLHRSNDEWIVDLLWATFKAAGYLLWLAILFPTSSVPAFISLAVMLCYGVGAGMLTAVGLGGFYGLWASLDPSSFESWSDAINTSTITWGGWASIRSINRFISWK